MQKLLPRNRWRLIAPRAGDGASHMALDQALLEAAAADDFPPTLRFYRWTPPALSIGRFQKIGDIDLKACEAERVEVVRRPTGGRSILHLDDFTYSLVLPARFRLPTNVVEAYAYISRGIIAALSCLGIEAAVQKGGSDRYAEACGACFAATTQADLKHAGRKICGSAQVRRGGAILQHGSLLLEDRSELLFRLLHFENERERSSALTAYRESCVNLAETGLRASWEEIALSFRRGFEENFGIQLQEEGLTPEEMERWRVLIPAYRSREWLINSRADAFPPEAPRHPSAKSVKIIHGKPAEEEDGA